jgi:outer membrane protein
MMKVKSKRATWIIAIILVPVIVTAQPDTTKPKKYELTVKEAVDLAFKNVTELKNANLDYRIQEAKNKEITGQALPQVSANGGLQYYFSVPKFPFTNVTTSEIYRVLRAEGVNGSAGPITGDPAPTVVPFSFQQPWNFTMGATLTQLLFQPDVFVGLQARKAALGYNQALIEQTKERIKDSAYKRYYAILIAQKQLHFLDESLKRLARLYHDDSIMFKNGFAERLDLDKVQVQLNNVTTTRNMVESGITIAYAAMKFAMGISQRDTVVLKEELSNESIKEGILNDSFKYEDRAEIRTLNTLVDLQRLDVKRYKLNGLPTLSLAGNYTVNAMGPDFVTDKESTTWFRSSYIGVNVNVPIFSGFQRKYKLEQSKLALEKVNNNVENVKQAIDLEQVITKESLKNSLVNLDIQERNLSLAEKVYNATKTKFEQGIGSSFEVLQSDTDYQTAQSNYFNALYNATVARISYLYSLGKL